MQSVIYTGYLYPKLNTTNNHLRRELQQIDYIDGIGKSVGRLSWLFIVVGGFSSLVEGTGPGFRSWSL